MARTHGLASTYRDQRSACRCDECRAASTKYQQEGDKRRRARLASLPAEAHGRATTYQNWGCRCDACKAAYVPINARRYKKVGG